MFWVIVLLAPSLALLPDVIAKAWRGTFNPNLVDKIILNKSRKSGLGKSNASIHPLKHEGLDDSVL
jgi:hypothetical protein